jgi:hypothetical protein
MKYLHIVLLGSMLLTSCQRREAHIPDKDGQLRTSTLEAESQLRAFLQLSIATRPAFAGQFDSVYVDDIWTTTIDSSGGRPDTVGSYACEAARTMSLWVADSRIMSFVPRGDSIDATVVLTTVALQQEDSVEAAQRSGVGDVPQIVMQRVRDDTVHFLLLHQPSSNGPRWMVCGGGWMDQTDANGDRQFVSVLRYGRTLRWEPDGSSALTARRLVDSVRRARGLPLAHTPTLP